MFYIKNTISVFKPSTKISIFTNMHEKKLKTINKTKWTLIETQEKGKTNIQKQMRCGRGQLKVNFIDM